MYPNNSQNIVKPKDHLKLETTRNEQPCLLYHNDKYDKYDMKNDYIFIKRPPVSNDKQTCSSPCWAQMTGLTVHVRCIRELLNL